jgi:hypothetical protein
MIKNTTPYIGKIRLKFEKYPEYTGKSKLNKIHLDLGFTKLVSRITPQQDLSGWLINPECKYLIEKNTGGKIGNHNFGKTIQEKREYQLPNSFLTKDGTYIGDIERGWWYYKNNMVVCEDYPHGVAVIIEYNDMYPDQQFIAGYHGYTHRGGQTFKIGDRLFEASYQPKEEDYEEWEWAGWKLDFEKRYSEGDDLDKRWMKDSGISYVIPYKKRGNKVIETWEEALQAAINMSKDLS